MLLLYLLDAILPFDDLNTVDLVDKQGHALKNCVEGVSDEAFYPWESPKKNLT